MYDVKPLTTSTNLFDIIYRLDLFDATKHSDFMHIPKTDLFDTFTIYNVQFTETKGNNARYS